MSVSGLDLAQRIAKAEEDIAAQGRAFTLLTNSLLSRIAEKDAENEALRAALAPFAEEGRNLGNRYRDDQNNGELIFHVCVGDFKRALAALNGRCATEGCYGRPAYRLEAKGGGSDYCGNCATTIMSARQGEGET